MRPGQIRLGGQDAGIDRGRLSTFALRCEHIAEVLLRFGK